VNSEDLPTSVSLGSCKSAAFGNHHTSKRWSSQTGKCSRSPALLSQSCLPQPKPTAANMILHHVGPIMSEVEAALLGSLILTTVQIALCWTNYVRTRGHADAKIVVHAHTSILKNLKVVSMLSSLLTTAQRRHMPLNTRDVLTQKLGIQSKACHASVCKHARGESTPVFMDGFLSRMTWPADVCD
jgi:hypothetical protein